MSSGLVNDILQENILKLESFSNQIFTQLAELGAHEQQIGYSASSNSLTSTQQVEIVSHLNEVRTTLNDISALVNQLKRSRTAFSKTSNTSNDKTLSLDQLTTIFKSFENGSIINGLNLSTAISNEFDLKQFALISKLETLSVLYSFIALYQITLSDLLNATIPLGDDLFYWDLTHSSTWRSILYSIQTLPIRATKLISNVFKEIKDNTNPDIESLDVQVPQYITNKYPGYQNAYKRIVYYIKLLSKSLYSNILTNNLKGFYKTLNQKKGIQLFGVERKPPIFKNYLSIIIGAPLSSIYEELKNKRSYTEEQQNKNAETLGSLIRNIPNVEALLEKPELINNELITFNKIIGADLNIDDKDFIKSLYNTLTISVPNLRYSFKSFEQNTKKPGFLTRYWPTILLGLFYGPNAIISILSNKDEIIRFFKVNVVETIRGFGKNWILKPINNILSTIRHDDNSEISIMSKSGLQSDLDSLKRMVIDYSLESDPQYKNLSPSELDNVKIELERLVSTGDLTPLMKEYENDIKEPFKGVLKGTLTRGLLIQLQKTKVDGAVAINGIDKLLKSQELVFGIVAASPSLLIVFYLSKSINSYLTKGYITRSSGEKKLIVSRNLSNIERLLNTFEEGQDESELDHINGLLLLEMISLRKSGLELIPKNRRFEWIRDINDLNNGKASVHYKLNIVNRIYHVYSQYF